MKSQWHVLVVDDEPVMRDSLQAWLREDGYAVDTAASGHEAIRLAQATDYAVYLVDLKMPPGMDGIETMMEIRRIRPEATIFIITAHATVDTAVAAMKEGAQDYIVKPVNPEEISLVVERVIRVKNLERENALLRQQLSKTWQFHDVVSKSPKMQEIFQLAQTVASLRSTVLVTGDSGTGKEMIVRAIHYSGDRAKKPFVAVSCAALTETLLESELFGHERGAFTGATARKRGKFELADHGTLFLDEIGDISPKLQLDLLRVLEERAFYRVGGTDKVSVDVRVMAATNRDLHEAVREGRFREDLYYRLNVISIWIPPLRDRREDIPLLAEHFLEKISAEVGRKVTSITEGALRKLMEQDWPGNVRQLENAIERAIVTCRSERLAEEDFAFLAQMPGGGAGWSAPPNLTLREIERLSIEAALRRTSGNRKEAAQILGIDRSTLYDKLKRHGIERE